MILKEKAVKLTSLAALEAKNAVIKNKSIQHYIFESSYAVPIDLKSLFLFHPLTLHIS